MFEEMNLHEWYKIITLKIRKNWDTSAMHPTFDITEHVLVLLWAIWVFWRRMWRNVMDHEMLQQFGDNQEEVVKRLEGQYRVHMWIEALSNKE